jgi:hypothetical protein
MKATPLFIGACALASIGGIVSGATINTKVIQHAGIGMEEINRPSIAFDPADTGVSDQVAPPDHYAMRTPEGRIEVADKSTPGLNSQRRIGWDTAWTPPPPPPLPEPAADPDWAYVAPERQVEPAVTVEPAVVRQGVETAAAAMDEQRAGNARLIVVQPALAANES